MLHVVSCAPTRKTRSSIRIVFVEKIRFPPNKKKHGIKYRFDGTGYCNIILSQVKKACDVLLPSAFQNYDTYSLQNRSMCSRSHPLPNYSRATCAGIHATGTKSTRHQATGTFFFLSIIVGASAIISVIIGKSKSF